MSRMKKKKKSNFRRLLIRIIEFILVLVIAYSGFKIVTWWRENRHNKKILEDLEQSVQVTTNDDGDKEYVVDFETLKNTNTDTVAWLKVEGTDIRFPVVKTTNNDYYINHSFDRSYNSAGWIFMDYANKLDGTDKNIVIYGHNRRDTSMFGTLKNILEENWYNNPDNYIITLVTEEGNIQYEVFSVYKIEIEDYYITTRFANDTDYSNFLQKIKSRSIKNFNVDLTTDDTILTLSTCANNNNYRIVLHAKKIVPIEDIVDDLVNSENELSTDEEDSD